MRSILLFTCIYEIYIDIFLNVINYAKIWFSLTFDTKLIDKLRSK